MKDLTLKDVLVALGQGEKLIGEYVTGTGMQWRLTGGSKVTTDVAPRVINSPGVVEEEISFSRAVYTFDGWRKAAA